MSGMLAQTLVVAPIVLAAGSYLGRRVWRVVAASKVAKRGGGCDSGCGCGH